MIITNTAGGKARGIILDETDLSAILINSRHKPALRWRISFRGHCAGIATGKFYQPEPVRNRLRLRRNSGPKKRSAQIVDVGLHSLGRFRVHLSGHRKVFAQFQASLYHHTSHGGRDDPGRDDGK